MYPSRATRAWDEMPLWDASIDRPSLTAMSSCFASEKSRDATSLVASVPVPVVVVVNGTGDGDGDGDGTLPWVRFEAFKRTSCLQTVARRLDCSWLKGVVDEEVVKARSRACSSFVLNAPKEASREVRIIGHECETTKSR